MLFSLLLYLIGIFLSWRSTKDVLSLPIYAVSILVFPYIGLLIIGMNEGNFRYAELFAFGILAMGFGSWFTECFSCILHNIQATKKSSKNIKRYINRKSTISLLLTLWGTSLIVTPLSLHPFLKCIPLLSDDPDKMRQVIAFGEGIFIHMLKGGIPGLWILALVSIEAAYKRRKVFLFTLPLFIIWVVEYILWGHKGMILETFAYITILWASYSSAVSKRAVFKIAFVGILSGIFLALFIGSIHFGNPWWKVDWLINRATVLAGQGFALTIEYFGDEIEFLGGRGIISQIVNFITQREASGIWELPLGQALSTYIHGSNPYGYTFTVTLLGNGFANGGLIGLVLAGFAGGIIASILHQMLKRAKNLFVKAFLLGISWIFLMETSRGDFPANFIDLGPGFLATIVLSWLLYVVVFGALRNLASYKNSITYRRNNHASVN